MLGCALQAQPVIAFQRLAVTRQGAADAVDESRQLRVILQLQAMLRLTFVHSDLRA